jgi:hypothetical protein
MKVLGSGRAANTSSSLSSQMTRVHGIACAQLSNYRLEKIVENEHKTDAPSNHREVFFSTHDVTVNAWRPRTGPLTSLCQVRRRQKRSPPYANVRQRTALRG